MLNTANYGSIRHLCATVCTTHVLCHWKILQSNVARVTCCSLHSQCVPFTKSVSQNCSMDDDNVNNAAFNVVELLHADTVTETATSDCNMLLWHLGITRQLPHSVQSMTTSILLVSSLLHLWLRRPKYAFRLLAFFLPVSPAVHTLRTARLQ